jgi:hypothetical protein
MEQLSLATIGFSAGISLITAILTAIVTSILTRRREHQADWRRLKFAQYQEFVLALSGIVEGRASPEGHRRYTDAVNSMALIASPLVLTALREFQAEISFANVQRSATKHDRLLDQLFRVMRSDLHPARDANDLSFTLGVIGVPPQ